ncbi:MAG: hypothetical protein ACLFP2_00380 [Candidatus Woesearchaeota archaeon]
MDKKGETGISVLFVIIGSILIVTAVVGLYLVSTDKLQTQGLNIADKSERSVSNKLKLDDLSSTYTSDYMLKDMEAQLRLETGSDGVKLSDIALSIKSPNSTSKLVYKGVGSSTEHASDGYFTFGHETYDVPGTTPEDFDEDNVSESLTRSEGYAWLNLSGGDDVRLGGCTAPATFNPELEENEYVKEVTGTCEDSNVTSVTVTPYRIGEGYFTAQYLKKGDHPLENMITNGDIFKIYFEMQEPLDIEQIVTINVVTQSGAQTPVMFITPDTPKVGRVSLSHY